VSRKLAPWQALASLLALVSVAAALVLALRWAPTERTMGDVQRIFYFHVPSAWVAFLCFFLVFAGSVGTLVGGRRGWDILALSAAEVGVLFCTIVLVTGPIWARPAWGIWWTWDARLTSTLMLWLTYVAYLLLRHYAADARRRATLAAVVGILGFLDVPIVYFSIRWWRTQHPQPVIMGGKGSGLAPDMALTFLVCLVAVTLLGAALLLQRIRLEYLRDEAYAADLATSDLEADRT